MHLKSLTLKGFKSFADPTTFVFEPGVTCVVGPNGSGKSNVVDGLAWVMGEQGAKSLRGGSMEDVIFAGTQFRGPLGRAEVSLTIDNSDGALPIEYTEVTISRTLFRNGASEYAINREPCRLLDVQELLSDTGLGREMHVIVGQGQLDGILHASPDDRRRFIEEAAGILKHRRRKERTLRKLDAMEANLTRLNDLAGEIRRQLTPLGRQAAVARQAQTIQAVVRDAKARVLADDVVTLTRELEDYHRTEGDRSTERAVLTEELSRIVANREQLETELTSHQAENARRMDFEVRRIAERIDALHALATERVSLLAQGDVSPLISQTVTDEDVNEVASRIEDREKALAVVEEELAERTAETAEAQARLNQASDVARASQKERQVWEHTRQQRESALEVAKSRLEQAHLEAERVSNQLLEVETRLSEAEALWRELSPQEGTDSDAERRQAESALQDAWDHEARVKAAVDAARAEVHSLEREKDSLAAKVSALSLAVESTAFDPEVVGAAGVSGRVADALTIQPGCEVAIARALGALADALLVDSKEAAWDVARRLSGRSDGRVDLIVATSGQDSPSAALAGLTPASEVVQGPAGVIALLRNTYIASSLDDVQAQWVSAKTPAGTVIVTTAGDVFGPHVVQTGGGAQRSVVELVAERDLAKATLREVTGQIGRAEKLLEEQTEALEKATLDVKQCLQVLRETEATLAEVGERISGAKARVEAARAERDRLQERRVQVHDSVTRSEEAVQSAEMALAEHLQTPVSDLDDAHVDQRREELETTRQAEVEVRLRLEAARGELRSARDDYQQLLTRRADEQRALEAHEQRQAERIALFERAQRVSALTPLLQAVARTSVEESQAEVARMEHSRRLAEESLHEARAQEVSVRERLGHITESVHSIEMHIYERKLQLGQLIERARDELGLEESVLVAEYGPLQPVPVDSESDSAVERQDDEVRTVPFVRSEQVQRLQKAERALAQLGRVNPLALEEFHALEARHKYLVEQLEDVMASKKDLLAIIEDLDGTMQEIFHAAFEDTKRAFDEVFPVLFPGGQGALTLTDPDNLLTTGIEVSVRPHGKKIERLSLLSGGERSLAAVALLMAIFIARPSPFYILDEVEAALDDANLGRLLTVLENLRKDSQLIIITHQKRTMEIADALYGVSMKGDGVSAVVGQRVAESQKAAS